MAKATSLRVNLMTEDEGATAVIELFEFIDPWWGFSAVELSDKLKELTGVGKIKVRIHSRGGNAMEGFAIFSLLAAHPATVEAEIIGVAASAASVVAMSADTIRISEVGFMMIHDPWVFADGNSVALRRAADMLDRIQPAIVRAYERHAKLSAQQIADAMSVGEGAGTWYDAAAALEAGLAHEIFTGPEPENRVALRDLDNVPKAALELFAADPAKPPEKPKGDNQLLAEVLTGLRDSGPAADVNALSVDARIGGLVENLLEAN